MGRIKGRSKPATMGTARSMETSAEKMLVSAAPINIPDERISYADGRQAGEADRELFPSGEEVDISKAGRIIQRHRNLHNLACSLVERDFIERLTQAQAAHEAASQRLSKAMDDAESSGIRVLAASHERTARARHIISLVNPELASAREDGPGSPPALPNRSPAEQGLTMAAAVPPLYGPSRAPDKTSDAKLDAKPPAFRHILERKLPKGVGYIVLAALAAAEGFLNAQAFAATGATSYESLVLAILVGIGVIGLSHRIGDCLADLLENRTRARGRSPARITELSLTVPALAIGILGTAAIRARYFAEQNRASTTVHISIPTPGLIALAFMLAAAAVAVSMAMRNPFADELTHHDRMIEDLDAIHQEAREQQLKAQHEVSATGARLLAVLLDLERMYRTQIHHVRLTSEAYLRGYSSGAGIRVPGDLPDLPPSALVATALTWIMEYRPGTVAPLVLPFSAAPGALPSRWMDSTPADPPADLSTP